MKCGLVRQVFFLSYKNVSNLKYQRTAILLLGVCPKTIYRYVQIFTYKTISAALCIVANKNLNKQ